MTDEQIEHLKNLLANGTRVFWMGNTAREVLSVGVMNRLK